MTRLRVAAAQLNTVVGDLDGNAAQMIDALSSAEQLGCDLLVGPELAVTGYPPEDLVLKPGFVTDNIAALEKVAGEAGRCAALVGFVDRDDDGIYNAAAICAEGEVRGIYRKRLLPNYSVFDEERYFEPGSGPLELFDLSGVRVGVSICEDIWSEEGPVPELAERGADVVINLNASPYYQGRLAEREAMLTRRAAQIGCPIVYVNQVGGQDELIFDGATLVYDASGDLVARGRQFEVGSQVIEVGGDAPASATGPIVEPLEPLAEVYEALALGTRDYVAKNGFSDVVIGLSGGIDSSMVAAIAADALGPERVHGVLMPSRYSSDHSVTDAGELVANLGIDHRVIPIEEAHETFLAMLAPSFEGHEPDVTEENLQSRIRGLLLMALSNKFGWMVLTTGNKSESAVGYSTLYGDTAGGFAVIKDVPKLGVYALAADRNDRAGRALIPESVLTKPPSAELRPDQRDDQSLPPYEVLDPILQGYVEEDQTLSELVAAGHDPDITRRIVGLVDRAEYKRRQSPPGPRVTDKAFGKDRRLPITNHYRR